MRIILVILSLIIFLARDSLVLAGNPPEQTSPANNSTVSSSTMSWQAPSYQLYSSGNPYRIQVDNDNTFTSIDKDYYTTSVSYSPSLTNGTWYWKVKAKDSTGTWSDWSSIWSFILDPTTISPSPSPSASSSPTSSFTITSIPTQINSDESFVSTVNLTLPANPNTKFYLKGAFKKPDTSNYFGLTKVGNSWVGNSNSYSDQLSITTNSSGSWSGNLEVKPDPFDSGYDSSGTYLFKIGRYSENGSGPNWSNEVSLNINAKPITVADNNLDFSKINAASVSSNNSKLKIIEEDLPVEVYSLEKYRRTASIAGTTAATPLVRIDSQKQNNFSPLLFLGGGLISGAFSYIIYTTIKHKRHDNF